MIVTCAVVGLMCAAVLGGRAAAAPRRPLGQQSAARRRRFVQRHPLRATAADIQRELLAQGLTEDQARFVTDRAAAHGINAYTMWLCVDRFDAETLALVVAADVPVEQLLVHVTDGSLPDVSVLRFFAAANGLDLTRRAAGPRARKVLVDSGLTTPQRQPLPPIHEPGSWAGFVRHHRLDDDGGLAA